MEPMYNIHVYQVQNLYASIVSAAGNQFTVNNFKAASYPILYLNEKKHPNTKLSFSPQSSSRQPLTSAALSLMNPSHCSAAFQSPEGTVLLAMQSSQYAVLSKCFSAPTFSGWGHLSASARCTLPGLIMLAWHWISNQCHATCWSNHWAMVCIGTLRYIGVHVEHEKQAMIQALFGCKVNRYISKDTYMLFKLHK